MNMEDILKRNVFNSKDLHRLSPDYNPTGIYLRMQMRRETIRDMHGHSRRTFTSVISQRKNKTGIKVNHRVNKEIAKIRNGFQNINIKNQLLLKNSKTKIANPSKFKIKRVSKSNEFLNNLNNQRQISGYKDDINKLDARSDFSKYNEIDFKTDNLESSTADNDYFKKETEFVSSNTDGYENSIEVNEDYPKIESSSDVEVCNNKENGTIYRNTIKYPVQQDSKLLKFSPKLIDKEQVSELQNLLIMMAISPESHDSETNCIAANKEIRSKVAEINVKELTVISKPVEFKDTLDVLSIVPIRIEFNEQQKQILEKYVKKWREYVNHRKESLFQQRKTTLNNFIERLEKKKKEIDESAGSTQKAKLYARDFNSYQHRYKVQKHIIALQKAKLEQQNRMIEELKYNKIVEASRMSVDVMREEVRKTYYEIDRQLKPKIKCLSNELKIHDVDEPSLVLHCLKVPQFLQRMEKRARDREEKHAMIRERRKQMEDERIRLKQQAEIAKAEMDKEEKMRRINELREKRKREKIENIRKKQLAERMRSLIVMADLHYEKNLMIKYGVRPLKKLLEIKKDNMEKAKVHYSFQLKKNVFLNWMWYTEDMWFERNYKAEEFYRKKVLKTTFLFFKQNHYEYILKKQVAEDYYDFYVTQLVFRKFLEGIQILRKEYVVKWHKAEVYHNSNLLFKTFTSWRTLPALNALKRQQEARKARWREKVLMVVPDYTPPDD